MARTLVNAHQLAPFSGSTATTAKFAQGVYTGGMSMESGSISSAGTISFYDGGSIAFAGSKIQMYNDTNIEGDLAIDGSLTVDAVELTSTELAYLDGLTIGTAAGSKAMVLDANADIAGGRNLTISGELDAATGDFSGNIDVDGIANLDAVDIDGVVQIDGATTFGVNDTGVDVKMFGATSGKYLLWDESGDELVLAGDGTKISFYDAGGGESISADGSGELTIAAGTEIELAATTVEVSADTFEVGSANSADPLVILKNTTNDAAGSRLRFVKDKGAAGADNDVAGQIEFYADDDNQDQVMFAKIVASVADASNGAEGGKLALFVAEHDGTATAGITLQDGDADGEIDVTLGAGASSVVTVPGNLVVTGTTTTVNTVTMEAANAVVFEGATADANETTLTIIDPDGDRTIKLPNQSGCIPVLAADSAVAISATPAELNVLDGSTAVGSSVTIADADGLILHDNGTMKTIPATDLRTYCATSLSSSGEIYSAAELRTSGDLEVSGSVVLGKSGANPAGTILARAPFSASFGMAVFGEEGADGIIQLAADEADDADDRWQLTAMATSAQFELKHGSGTAPIVATAAGNVTVLGDLTISGDDLFMATNTSGYMLVADGTNYNPVAISGDVTMAANGAVTIAAGAVENSMLADDAVGADELAANAVVNASVLGSAAIEYSKMEAVAGGSIIVGNGSNVGTIVAVSGDATLSNAGVLTIAANAVEGSMLNTDVISGQTALASGLAATDELMVSDGGTLKRMDVSVLSAFQAGPGAKNVSGELGVDFVIDTVVGSNGHNYTSATGVYTLSNTGLTGSEMVHLNGQMLMPGADLAGGDYTCATGSVELHPDLQLDGDDVLRVYYLK